MKSTPNHSQLDRGGAAAATRSLFLLAVFPLLLATSGCGNGRQDDIIAPEETVHVEVANALGAGAFELPGVVGYEAVVNAADYRQGVLFGLEDENVVYVRNLERPNALGEWSESKFRFSCSYEIVDVAPRIADEFYVLGRAGNQDWIVEHWLLSPVKGAWRMTRSALGAVQFVVTGGVFVDAAARSAWPALRRAEIYRGAGFDEILSVAADPDGSFLLLICRGQGSTTLQRLSLDGSGSFTTVLRDSDWPILAQMDTTTMFEHETQGRLVLLTNENGPEYVGESVLLFDANSDGEPDPGGVQVLDRAGLEAAGYLTGSWRDFVNFN